MYDLKKVKFPVSKHHTIQMYAGSSYF